jgi:hypothetical protein
MWIVIMFKSKSNPKKFEVFSMILMKVLVHPKLLPLADHSG